MHQIIIIFPRRSVLVWSAAAQKNKLNAAVNHHGRQQAALGGSSQQRRTGRVEPRSDWERPRRPLAGGWAGSAPVPRAEHPTDSLSKLYLHSWRPQRQRPTHQSQIRVVARGPSPPPPPPTLPVRPQFPLHPRAPRHAERERERKRQPAAEAASAPQAWPLPLPVATARPRAPPISCPPPTPRQASLRSNPTSFSFPFLPSARLLSARSTPICRID